METKMDNSQLISRELIKKSFEESLLDKREEIKMDNSKFK